MIKRIWPGQSLRASLLTPQALADPATGMDLIPKELARLLASLRPDAPPSPSSDPENRTTASFQSDAASVENFCARLSSENSLTNLQSLVLQRLRAALHTIRHIGEAIGEFADSNASLPDAARLTVTPLAKTIQDSLNLAAKATASLAPQDIQSFYDGTKHHGSGIEAARNALNDSLPHFPPEVRMSMAALVDDFDIAIWLIHRLAKLEIRLSNPAPA
jgi:phosphate:Na+ symporter